MLPEWWPSSTRRRRATARRSRSTTEASPRTSTCSPHRNERPQGTCNRGGPMADIAMQMLQLKKLIDQVNDPGLRNRIYDTLKTTQQAVVTLVASDPPWIPKMPKP